MPWKTSGHALNQRVNLFKVAVILLSFGIFVGLTILFDLLAILFFEFGASLLREAALLTFVDHGVLTSRQITLGSEMLLGLVLRAHFGNTVLHLHIDLVLRQLEVGALDRLRMVGYLQLSHVGLYKFVLTVDIYKIFQQRCFRSLRNRIKLELRLGASSFGSEVLEPSGIHEKLGESPAGHLSFLLSLIYLGE